MLFQIIDNHRFQTNAELASTLKHSSLRVIGAFRQVCLQWVSMYLFEISILLLFWFLLIRPFYHAYLFTKPPRLRVTFFTPTSLGVAYEDVTLTSKDGVTLDGWYIKSRNGAAVIMLHGHSGNRLAANYHVEALIRAGYGIVMFDLRAHGNSGGRRFARSQHEVDDVLTAVTFLSKRPDVTAASIGIVGISVGGMLAIQAAAQTVAIRAIWVDGPSPAVFADFYAPHSWRSRYELMMERFYMWLVDWMTKRPSLPATVEILPEISPRPIYIVSTGKKAEHHLCTRFYEKALEPKTLWEIPEGRHAEGWYAREDEYGRKLVTFFDQNLVHKNSTRILLPDA